MSDRNRSSLSSSPSDLLTQQAAEWLVRRAGDEWAHDDEQRLQRWLRQDAAHAQAFAHAERIWQELAGLGELPDAQAADAAPQLSALPMVGRPGAAISARRRRLWQGMAAGCVAAAALWMGSPAERWQDLQADYHTAVGERRSITLPDGSQVQLGGNSAVAVRYGAQQRMVELLRGEALFEALPVQHAEAAGRPFVVAAAEGRTRALGTRFIVERMDGHTRVTGVEHRVEVALDAAPQPSVIVAPGQLVRYDQQGLGPVEHLGIDPGRTWAQGLLVFERMALSDVVGRLDRYHGARIVIRDQQLAQRRVSGVFPAADAAGALRAVAQELGLRLLELPGWVLVF